MNATNTESGIRGVQYVYGMDARVVLTTTARKRPPEDTDAIEYEKERMIFQLCRGDIMEDLK